jgi:hypothetical protein
MKLSTAPLLASHRIVRQLGNLPQKSSLSKSVMYLSLLTQLQVNERVTGDIPPGY